MTTNEQESKLWNKAGATDVTPESVAASRAMSARMLATADQYTEVGVITRPIVADIIVDHKNVGSFYDRAGAYAYKPELRAVITGLYESAKRSTNRWFVLENTDVRAAQSTGAGAMNYMRAGFILVEIRLGCGRMTHVIGTNDGTMPCGAKFNGEPYYCDTCEGR